MLKHVISDALALPNMFLDSMAHVAALFNTRSIIARVIALLGLIKGGGGQLWIKATRGR